MDYGSDYKNKGNKSKSRNFIINCQPFYILGLGTCKNHIYNQESYYPRKNFFACLLDATYHAPITLIPYIILMFKQDKRSLSSQALNEQLLKLKRGREREIA